MGRGLVPPIALAWKSIHFAGRDGPPGVAENVEEVCAEALYLRDHFLEQLELANIDDDPERARARRTVVIVGASYSGTELAAQLCALADAAAAQMALDRGSVRLLLLDMADRVMPEVGERLGTPAMTVLRTRGIEVRLSTSL